MPVVKPLAESLQKELVKEQEQAALKHQLRAYRKWFSALDRNPPQREVVPGYASGGRVWSPGYAANQLSSPAYQQYTPQELEYIRLLEEKNRQAGAGTAFDVIPGPGNYVEPTMRVGYTPQEQEYIRLLAEKDKPKQELVQLLEPQDVRTRQEIIFRGETPEQVAERRAETVLRSVGPRGAYASQEDALAAVRKERRNADQHGVPLEVLEDGSVAAYSDERALDQSTRDVGVWSAQTGLGGYAEQMDALSSLSPELRKNMQGFRAMPRRLDTGLEQSAGAYKGQGFNAYSAETMGRAGPDVVLHEIGHHLLMNYGAYDATQDHQILGLLVEVWKQLKRQGVPLTDAAVKRVIASAQYINFQGTGDVYHNTPGIQGGYPTQGESSLIQQIAPQVVRDILSEDVPGYAEGGRVWSPGYAANRLSSPAYDDEEEQRRRNGGYTDQELAYIRLLEQKQGGGAFDVIPGTGYQAQPTMRVGYTPKEREYIRLLEEKEKEPEQWRPGYAADKLEESVEATAARLNPAASAYEAGRQVEPGLRPSNVDKNPFASLNVFERQAEIFRGMEPGTRAARALGRLEEEERQALLILAQELEKDQYTTADLERFFQQRGNTDYLESNEPIARTLRRARETMQLITEKKAEVRAGKGIDQAVSEIQERLGQGEVTDVHGYVRTALELRNLHERRLQPSPDEQAKIEAAFAQLTPAQRRLLSELGVTPRQGVLVVDDTGSPLGGAASWSKKAGAPMNLVALPRSALTGQASTITHELMHIYLSEKYPRPRQYGMGFHHAVMGIAGDNIEGEFTDVIADPARLDEAMSKALSAIAKGATAKDLSAAAFAGSIERIRQLHGDEAAARAAAEWAYPRPFRSIDELLRDGPAPPLTDEELRRWALTQRQRNPEAFSDIPLEQHIENLRLRADAPSADFEDFRQAVLAGAVSRVEATLQERETGGVRPLEFSPLRTELPGELFSPLPDAIEGPARMTAEGVLSPLGIASGATFGAGQLLRGSAASVGAGAATAPLGPIPQQAAMIAADVLSGGPSRSPGRLADDVPAIRNVADDIIPEAGMQPGARTPRVAETPTMGAEPPTPTALREPDLLPPSAASASPSPKITEYLLDESGQPFLDRHGNPVPAMRGGNTVQRVIELLDQAVPLRESTDKLRSIERGKRSAAAAAKAEELIKQGVPYQEAYRRSSGELAGAYPTAAFTPPESGLFPEEIQDLYGMIHNKPGLLYFTRKNTNEALTKLLAGELPQPAEIRLLRNVFGGKLAEAILKHRKVGAWEQIASVLNVPRALQATADLSAPFRQGLMLVGRPQFWKSMPAMVKSFGSEDVAQAIDDALRAGQAPRSGRSWDDLMQRGNLYLAERGSAALADHEEAFMSTILRKVPGVSQVTKGSERAYVTFLNKLRADTFKSIVGAWERKGIDYADSDLKDLGKWLNIATGRGDLPNDWAPMLNAIMFSPKLLTARLETGPMAAKMLLTNGKMRMEVARDLVSTIGFGLGVLGMSQVATEAYERVTGKKAPVTFQLDPRSSDFGKVRFGNTRIDPWGGFQPIARYTAQIITGQGMGATGLYEIDRTDAFKRFLQSKLSPAAGIAADVLTGKTFMGDELEATPSFIGKQVYERLTPFFIQDVREAVQEYGAMGILLAPIPGLGMGLQTYETMRETKQAKLDELFEQGYFPERAEGGAAAGVRPTIDNLLTTERAKLKEDFPELFSDPGEEFKQDVREGVTETERDVLTGDFIASAKQTKHSILDSIMRDARTGRLGDLSEDTTRKRLWEEGKDALDDYREKVKEARKLNPSDWAPEDPTEKRTLDRFFRLIDSLPDVPADEDWARFDKGMESFTPDELALIEQQTGVGDHPFELARRDANKKLDRYWEADEEARPDIRAGDAEIDGLLWAIGNGKVRSSDHIDEALDAFEAIYGYRPPRSAVSLTEGATNYEAAVRSMENGSFNFEEDRSTAASTIDDALPPNDPRRKEYERMSSQVGEGSQYDSLESGKPRENFREQNPEIDAILWVLGKTSVVRSAAAGRRARELYQQLWGVTPPWPRLAQ